MFNVLVNGNGTAWETDQLMRIDASRFKEYSGNEAAALSSDSPEALEPLEHVDSLLLYESGVTGPSAEIVRLGRIHGISRLGGDLVFSFVESGRFSRKLFTEFTDRLGIDRFELNRTHWAVKDGGIPSGLLAKVDRARYEVVLSFAGENREYCVRPPNFARSVGRLGAPLNAVSSPRGAARMRH